MNKAVLLVTVTAVTLVSLLSLAGCQNKCVTLEEKLCTDLGPDCALWRSKGGPDVIIPKNRVGGGFSQGCDVLLDAYPTVLAGQKQVVAAWKAAAANKR